ncbi:MAG: DivIVA domain-containing protein [Brevibacterium aurantiacum]|uniref:Cell wall synthesis protein Wag31 n=1 Tax=Brevibacterium aurantiacum TaxID=273384 RepID=A0A2H1I0P9_BREAU|nr:DivIVA domain-containing protein [Brevibacterium aurantiacum]MDN5607926.1 DivIVA domain-containing protein [Brevibacterium sp.]AZT93820.1 DivIVA domain-containing protein [Brevibacterium aurantiacum]MDN5734687.1 DivIVA domain-containing protein [Brevibacterium aurantiacum]MDN6373445.1 DivIVA domain-containing protein [Brevibacterium aurantiacum]PCC46228.1 cell division protein DivIVA [Brevibacterium aurantiacum]
MALTPEDVVNKRFQHVKFRDGYDQDEVDDFLDEVVVEIRRLYQENDELRQKLSTAEQRVKELDAGGASAAAPAKDIDATQAMPAAVPAPSSKKAAEAPKQEQTPAAPAVPETTEQPSAPAVKEAAPAAQAPAAKESASAGNNAAPAAAAGTAAGLGLGSGLGSGDGDAHGLIALAQRVHDEHVAEGERRRDELIRSAETEAKDIVGKAETKRDETLSTLETQKSTLERSIDQLSNFERQYRTRLKSYLNDQLRDLENSTSLAPETLDGNSFGSSSNHKL